MGFDGLLLHCLVQELNEKLTNARVHHIAQPNANEICLTLRQPGANYLLLLSADPVAPRLHLASSEPANPLTPPAFCMLLRKHLDPARLLGIEQTRLDRVVTLRLETRDEFGRRAERHLILEIMGRHSNLTLVDPATQTILDGARHVTAEQSRYREVLPGKPYLPPPAQAKTDPFTVGVDQFTFNLRHIPAPQPLAQALVDIYDGIGPDAAREILARAGLPTTIRRSELALESFNAVWQAFQAMVTALHAGSVKPWGALDRRGKPAFFWVQPLRHLTDIQSEYTFSTVLALLDWYYGQRQQFSARENLRQDITRSVRAAWEKVVKRISLQEEALLAAARADEYRLKGELLLAHQHLVQPKATRVRLPNYYEPGSELEVELNPSLGASDNAQSYYRRYQKARKTQRQAQLQLDAALAERAYLESVMEATARATEIADLEEVKEELQGQGVIAAPAKQRPPAHRLPGYLRVASPDGMEILVGKNNRQNDTITMGVAKPDDLWLHVKDIPGAHVVIRSNGAPVSEETLTLALHLAAHYSQAGESSQVPVDYCARRYVRKPKGAKPGFVIYDHQKTAFITPDPQIIATLTR